MQQLKIDEENSDSGRSSLHSNGVENHNEPPRSISPLVKLLFDAEILGLHGYVQRLLSIKDSGSAVPDFCYLLVQ